MCADYIAAGLPPERFWEITPRLYLIEMKGAARRMQYERGLVWDNAVMARDGVKVPKRPEYTGEQRHKPLTWQQQLAAWEAYAAAQKQKAGD
jgi:hypothetical protein